MPTNPPSQPASANRPPCPSWCSPAHCGVTESGDVTHRSAPTRLETLDASYDLGWVKTDDLTDPDDWSQPPELQLHIESKMFAAAAGSEEPMTILTVISVSALPVIIAAFAEQMNLVRLPDGLVLQ